MGHGGSVRARVRVPAKINLFLAVEGLRDDGYHELTTVFQTVALHDRLTAEMVGEPAWLHPAHRRRLRVSLAHDAGPEVPTGRDNLVVRAAELLLEAMGVPVEDEELEDVLVATLELEKSIPVAAGMAGGSADAAAALVVLNELWDAGCTRAELEALGARLGADVPFCVAGGTSLATGTGTAVAPVLCHGEFHWVIGISPEQLSTPDVYRAWDDAGSESTADVAGVLAALRSGEVDELAAAVHNDLEGPAFSLLPPLRDRAERLRDAGAVTTLLSGSGPTLLGLASSEEHAVALANDVVGVFDRVVVASSPAGGPRLES